MRLRLKLRTAMVLTALIALSISGYQYAQELRTRSARYQLYADRHQLLIQLNEIVTDDQIFTVNRPPNPVPQDELDRSKTAVDFHTKRRDFYRNAASHPWVRIPVEPDPLLSEAAPCLHSQPPTTPPSR